MVGLVDSEFVELNRTFHELSQSVQDDGSELYPLYGSGTRLTWADLVSHYRVVLLSEAGSGKTAELRNLARRFKQDGKAAFFIRLEHVTDGLENALEIGTHDEFVDWLAGMEEGWVLLDSVDEARLRDPSDFERAIRSLARALGSAKQRTHLIITGRSTAWRPVTDLALVLEQLPYVGQIIDKPGEQSKIANSEAIDKQEIDVCESLTNKIEDQTYKVVTIDELSSSQIETYSRAKGVRDTRAFLEAIERADARSFTSRPQDLGDLVAFWNQHGRIGSRLELVKDSIRQRLEERDQRRADARPISVSRIRSGVRTVAAACTLSRQQTVRVPDGLANIQGLPVKDILTDWDDRDCATFLSRPVFDEAIYGTVRFHHRTVREYLTAEWFSHLLKQDSSRQRIEELFFRQQYGVEVVVPSLRPVLPWLALMDAKIQERVLKIAPEVFFEGGDPSRLPLETRQQILHQVCEKIASGVSGHSMMDYAAVQRFSGADLTGDVVALLKMYKGDGDLEWFLLRMVWQGQLIGALEMAESVAMAPDAEHYARIAAFQAVGALGSSADKARLRATFGSEPAPLDRDWLAEILEESDPTNQTVDWLFTCVRRTAKPNPHSVDKLADEIAAFFRRADMALLPSIVTRANELLGTEPFVERRHCEVSKDFAWFLVPVGVAIQRMIEARSGDALLSESLSVLYKLSLAREFSHLGVVEVKLDLKALVPAWADLNFALFWHIVEHQRVQREEKGERLTDWRFVGIWRSYVRFGPEAFHAVLDCVTKRETPDDKLVALTLAHRLYIDSRRPPKLRRLLRSTVRGDTILTKCLKDLMRPGPQPEEYKKYKRWERDQERRKAARQERDAADEARWHEAMRSNLDALRAPKLNRPDEINNWQYHVHERMRSLAAKNPSRSKGNWRVLEGEFCLEIALAFRDGVVAYWRRRKPRLRSENAPPNTRTFGEIFGLTGIDIEARETPDWPSSLTEKEADLAFRYAMHQLNGLPDWLPRLFLAFPELVQRMSLAEIRHELCVDDKRKESVNLLHKVSRSADWLWDAIAPELYEIVRKREPKSTGNLQSIAMILNGSSLPDAQIASLARRKAKSLKRPEHAAAWFATWAGVDPQMAVPAFQSRLNEIKDKEARTTFAMLFITRLVGPRGDGGVGSRPAYRAAGCLRDLYLIMHEHIRREEDIERAGTGVYSPGLRDDAQDARNHLLALLREIPGKETFLALEHISRAHPDEDDRPWFSMHAKSRAELDADNPPWTPEQVLQFQANLERTPTNNRDLFDLVTLRLSDLKDDLEDGDSSIAETLRRITDETELRNVIANWCEKRSANRYKVSQEEELADAKRPDLRFLGVGIDTSVPLELKLADNCSGPELFERLEEQLCGDYLRDIRSSRGIFLLVWTGRKNKDWQLANKSKMVNFDHLVKELQHHWRAIEHRLDKVDDIHVLGIDLTKRTNRTRRARNQAKQSTD